MSGSQPKAPFSGVLNSGRSAAAVQDILFYQLPQHGHFYPELVNMIAGGAAAGHATVTVQFAPEDAGENGVRKP